MYPEVWPTNGMHKKLTFEQMAERKRLAEEKFLTDEMRVANEELRMQWRASSQAQPKGRQAQPMLILRRCWPWLVATLIAALAIYVAYANYVAKAPAVQPDVVVPVPAASAQRQPTTALSSLLNSDDLSSSFKRATAWYQFGNSSAAIDASRHSHNSVTTAAAIAPTTVSLSSASKSSLQSSRRGGILPNPPSLSPPSNTASKKLSVATQTATWGSTVTSTTMSSRIDRLGAILASQASAISILGSFSQLWMYTFGGGLVLCLTVFGIRSLLGCGHSYIAGSAAGMSTGYVSVRQSEFGAMTPRHTPYAIDSPECSPARHGKTEEMLRTQRRMAESEEKVAQQNRRMEQQRQMMSLVEEEMQRATEREHEVCTQNVELKKTNERKSVALDLAKGKIAMLERENEALRRQLDSINAVTFHGPTLAQAQPTVLRNLDSLLAHTNDREGSPTGLRSPQSPTPIAATESPVASPAAGIISHAIATEDRSPADSDSDASDVSTPRTANARPHSSPEKTDICLDAPTLRPLTASPLRHTSTKGHNTGGCDSQLRMLRSVRSTRGTRALHAVEHPLSFSPRFNTGAASDDDEMVLRTTPTLPPFPSAAGSTFLGRDTSAGESAVGSPSAVGMAGRLFAQVLGSPAPSSDSNASEQPPLLLEERSAPVR